MKIGPVGAEFLQMDGRTDSQINVLKPTVVSHNFAYMSETIPYQGKVKNTE